MVSALSGQTLKAFITAADNAFVTKDYYSALVYYSNALEFDEENIDLQYQAAEASRLFNAYTPAEEKYQYVMDNDFDGKYPLSAFWLADIKQKKGKYEEAKTLFELYLSESEENKYFFEKAEKEIKACEWSNDIISNPDTSMTIVHLGDGINSPYSEFGALAINDEELLFSSLRYTKQDDIHDPLRTISKILISEDKTTGEMLDSDINKGETHIAHNTFSKDGTRIYYTECQYINSTEIRCDLFYRPVNEDGSYGTKVKLPETINADIHTSTQPNIGFDEETQKEILYFVSDREGGQGKMDLWYTTIEDENTFSEPVNLSTINTYEDDITPFYHAPSETLYFSSEGYQSLGGFDIFKVAKNGSNYDAAEHLTAHLNSSYHDIYFTLDDLSEEAHFSSNREGSYFLESAQEACCFDIYRVEYEELFLNLDALTFDKRTTEALPGASVRLINKKTGELIGEITDEDDNHHPFELMRDTDYIIIADKENYTPDTIEFSTKKIYRSEEFIKKLYLETDMVEMDVFTFDKGTGEALTGAKVRLIDLETGEIVGEEVFNPNSNQFKFNLVPCKKYQLIASKDGYDTITETFVADCNGKPMKKNLFLGFARNIITGVSSYLPLTLYFDNDIPDIRSVKTYTKKTYTKTYNPYIVKKEEFKTEYAKPLSGEQKNAAKQQVDDFFEFDVKGGYGQLNGFLEQLVRELESGQKMKISIKGYASPRASNRYNLALSKRRIHSLKNELVKYQNGILADYIVKNQLTVEELPFGEDIAPSGISDNIPDKRNSIYSVDASRERRIEITGVKYQ